MMTATKGFTTMPKPRPEKPNPYVRCIVQKRGALGWFDVSELFYFLPSAEAALARWREDFPNDQFRLASLEWGDER